MVIVVACIRLNHSYLSLVNVFDLIGAVYVLETIYEVLRLKMNEIILLETIGLNIFLSTNIDRSKHLPTSGKASRNPI